MPGLLIIGAPTTIAEDGKKKRLWWDYDLIARRVVGRPAAPWSDETWARITDMALGALATSRRVYLGAPGYSVLEHPYVRLQREQGLVAILAAMGRPRHGLLQHDIVTIQRDLVGAAAHLDLQVLETLQDATEWIREKETRHEVSHTRADGRRAQR